MIIMWLRCVTVSVPPTVQANDTENLFYILNFIRSFKRATETHNYKFPMSSDATNNDSTRRNRKSG